MDADGVFRYTTYSPEGVKYMTLGGSCYIGVVDDRTILKYPWTEGDEQTLAFLDAEARMLKAIGPHKYIVGFRGQRTNGLLLERIYGGSVSDYLKHNQVNEEQKLKWIYQITEAIVRVHKKHVIHRDINTNNILLDEGLNIKLIDFQGHLLGPNGEIEADGSAAENTKSSMPRDDPSHADVKTDIFALGSAFYYIMEGHEPFPDLDSLDDEDEIVERFRSYQFPSLQSSLMNHVTHKCWAGEYDTADAVLQDLNSEYRCTVSGDQNQGHYGPLALLDTCGLGPWLHKMKVVWFQSVFDVYSSMFGAAGGEIAKERTNTS
ncbi:MAG: hypothetical protein Q9217_002172 [Psora testacea]